MVSDLFFLFFNLVLLYLTQSGSIGNWEFSFSVYFVNVYYLSYLNNLHWKEPKLQEVDDCSPLKLVSSGYILWLALVPAVACVVQNDR
jgi:hypothetical protein